MPLAHSARWALALLVAACGCAADSPRDLFDKTVVPVLERTCTSPACHGVLPGAAARGEVIDWDTLMFKVNADQTIRDLDHAYEAAKRPTNSAEPEFSALLRKPLATAFGGAPHFGKSNFLSPDDAGYRAILRWIEADSGGGEKAEPLSPREKLFAETVQPVLASLMCTNFNCHGIAAAVPYRLDPGIGGRFSIEATRHNYKETLTMLSLDGDAMQSRIIRKALPLNHGGILHKGGNDAFLVDRDDPRIRAIVEWACAERKAATGQDCLSEGKAPIKGFVFVRGPHPARAIFDLDSFVPGSDLYYARVDARSLEPVEVTNLTAGLHSQPVDIRDPAVDPSGTKVLFSMRRSASEGHVIYELDLASKKATQITQDAGPLPGGGLRTDRDATYGPDGSIWFVSTRNGYVADRGKALDGDLFELHPQSGAITQRTWTPHVERKPVFFALGHFRNEVCFTALRDAIAGQYRAHAFRFPPHLKDEYHQHFGISPPENLFHDTRELPDGRNVVVIGDLDNAWPSGRLGIIDRNFGPEIRPGNAPVASSLPFYGKPLTRLGPNVSSGGISAGSYRDPVGLPDGRILVAHTPDSIDLGDPNATPKFRIEVLTVAEQVDGSGPRVVARRVLVEDATLSSYDAEPVFVRPALSYKPKNWTPGEKTGVVKLNGLSMIDALLDNLEPRGTKIARGDVKYIRLVEALRLSPNQRRVVPPGETRDGHRGATTASLGSKGPARILAEAPVAADGTAYFKVPAGVPFRLQNLDANGMAVGVMHNRWYHVAPGQSLAQGVSHQRPEIYAQRCAPCHGSIDGSPDDAFVVPDVLTTASLTLSRYDKQNARKPKEPVLAGDGTRIVVDFAEHVQPILSKRCASSGCHAGASPSAGVSLTSKKTQHYNDAYESLLAKGSGSAGGRRYVDEASGSAHGSYLIELLMGKELGAPRVLAQPGKPHVAELTSDELTTLVRWIDLGATFQGKAP